MKVSGGGGGVCLFFFFFNDTATTEIYTLSLHDALPISVGDLSIIVLKISNLRMISAISAPAPHLSFID